MFRVHVISYNPGLLNNLNTLILFSLFSDNLSISLTVNCDSAAQHPPPHPIPPHPIFFFFFFFFQICILCLNSLTRKLKIRVVCFVLKKLCTHFEMLIVSYVLHCVDGCCFGFLLF